MAESFSEKMCICFTYLSGCVVVYRVAARRAFEIAQIQRRRLRQCR